MYQNLGRFGGILKNIVDVLNALVKTSQYD